MKLTDVQLDAFGVWRDLRLRELSPQCTVFYGPNEAGKTTVLQFVRGVLYGFSAAGRARYLTTVDSDASRNELAGGALSVIDEDGRQLMICRRQESDSAEEAVTIERTESAQDEDLES
ncbi:MAG TPA: ATP-binding protein, partial [Pirellulales bacterium]